VQLLGVGPAFFETLGIRVLAGRTPDVHDGPNSPPVAVVNEPFARKYFPGVSAIGHLLESPQKSAGVPAEIVGRWGT
jgi:hypothetical protein